MNLLLKIIDFILHFDVYLKCYHRPIWRVDLWPAVLHHFHGDRLRYNPLPAR